MVSREDEEICLDEAALLIAAEEYPRLDADQYLKRLDYIGNRAREEAGSTTDAFDLIAALNRTLFERIGFRGNRQNYYDPRNSFLNEVIDRRSGIPITLTVVYIEVARRIGFPVKGVSLPFHFVAKHESAGGDVFIDAFNEGRLLGPEGCAEIVSAMSGGKLELTSEHLAPAPTKQILIRMLSNLAGIYSTNDQARALAAVERILLIDPGSLSHVRDQGLLLASLGRHIEAIAELERYLELVPEAADAESVRAQIKSIRQTHARLN